MRGIMFTAKGRAEIIEEPTPVCTDDTMLLRTLYSGLSNGTERSFLMGGSYGGERWPQRIAYQHVSQVVECGSRITRLAVGDIVYTGRCHGHVEYHLARESDLIVRLPEGLDLKVAALMGVASVSFHDARRGRIAPEDNVVVFGAGLIGQFAAQAARVRGAKVTVVDRLDDRLALAAELGADVVVNTSSEEGRQRLAAGGPYSAVFECSGADVLDAIIGRPGQTSLVGHRSHARLILVAGRFDVTYNFNAAGAAELDIIHTQHFDQMDLDQVLRLVCRGDIRIEPLIRQVVPLAGAPGVYDTLRDEPSALLGTVFDFTTTP
ncbi:MAG: zinc-binding dehydrogenase [Planctomycetes bacterium]|nr:zinc-binding dehydrogenase [Planctomycetota bacterium]